MTQEGTSYDAVIRRALGKAGDLAAARPRDAAALVECLIAATPCGRSQLYEKLPAAAHPDVVHAFLDRSWRLRRRDLPAALRLARLGLQAALRTGRAFPRRALSADLLAEAWAHVANLKRIQGDLRAAERLWPKVRGYLRNGTGDRGLLVQALDLEQSLKRAQRKFVEAIDLLHAALRFQAELNDPHGEGRLRAALAIAYSYEGKAQRAFEEMQRALELLDPGRDPELYFHVFWDSVALLADLGCYQEALVSAGACEIFWGMLDDPVLSLRGRWIKGRMHARCGEPLAAEAYLDRVRRGFRERALPYEAALATLDLALLHAEQHDYRKVKQLVEEMYPVFVDKAIPREAAASLLLFADSARRQGAAATAISELIDRLHALRLH